MVCCLLCLIFRYIPCLNSSLALFRPVLVVSYSHYHSVPGDYDVDGGCLGETVIVRVGGHGCGYLLVYPGGRGVMVCRGGSSRVRRGE